MTIDEAVEIVSRLGANTLLQSQIDAIRLVLADREACREYLKKIAALPHSNPSGDTLHGPCPRCEAEAALEGKR